MIPSSPRRTWLFLLASSLAYFGPDLLVPAAWAHTALYLRLSAVYQGALVVLGFWFAPAICRSMAASTLAANPLHAALEQGQAGLADAGLPQPPVQLFDHAMPFVLTAGLVPSQCEVFVSTGLVSRLSPAGLKFLLARAATHATLRQRLAALLPLLAFTVVLPDDLKSLATWVATGGFLLLWLMLHWLFELDADRSAARALGPEAVDALQEWLAVSQAHPAWLSAHPPVRWRVRAVRARA
ncbi:MAG: M48 family metalloprotease [Hyphomicrobiaceae bacterium]